MRQICELKVREIEDAARCGLSLREIERAVGCARGTVVRHLRLAGLSRGRSAGMREYHRRRREEAALCWMRQRYGFAVVDEVMACGKRRSQCVNCPDAFSEKCGFGMSWRVIW